MNYLVCSTPRTGSNLLTLMLATTGRAGNPKEFFEPQHAMPMFVKEVGMSSVTEALGAVPEYIEKLKVRYSTSNGAFGVKIHYEHFAHLRNAGTRLEDLLHPCRLVFCRRSNITRQAISLVRALQTNVWIAGDTPRSEPVFDADRITHFIHLIRNHNSSWEHFFTRQQVEPYRVAYETFVERKEPEIRALLEFLGVAFDPDDLASRISEAEPILGVQSDHINEEWFTRYTSYLARP
jgi:LPS sulfotransferase NodH